MLAKLLLVFKIPELRNKILLTLGLLCVYRLGYHVYLPFINQEAALAQMQNANNQGGGGLDQFMQTISLFSASQLYSIFGLGIAPYITASIIFQLLGTVYPPLEQLQKEGEAGRRKINEYTRYATVLVCLIQSYVWILAGMGRGGESIIMTEYNTAFHTVIATITMTAGAVFLMWIGEQIDAYGIGNGISLLIMAGIIARMPDAGVQLLAPAFQQGIKLGSATGVDRFVLLAALFVTVVFWVVLITEGQRRIPIQSAKHVRGRRVMGGQRQFLPLRVNQAGVMPIVFASSILVFPMFFFRQLYAFFPSQAWAYTLADAFGMGRGYTYNTSYILLIYVFCYFWVAVTFNPKDISDNLKDYGSFIPGYRPGARTAQFLEQVMTRITYLGAGFLALVAVIPTLISHWMEIPYLAASFYGGTGLLIVVSVALDLVQKIDSHLVMRNYPGLLDSDA
jgi:preprotein translocase subunit SecY